MRGWIEQFIALVVGREVAELHQRWCIEKEKDHLRSLSPTKPLPTTLHAARHQRSFTNEACSPKKALMPSAPSTTLTTPCPGIEAAVVMPSRHYTNVHSHYATIPVNEVPDLTEVSEIMQTYNYGQLETSHRVNFHCHKECSENRMPSRKRNDLEKLPALSDELAGEIERRKEIREQAAIFAEAREAREEETEKKRRSSTAERFPMPPFQLHLNSQHMDNINGVDPLMTQATVNAAPERECMRGHTRDVHVEKVKDLGFNCAGQPPAQCAPKLMQQKQKQRVNPEAQRRPSPLATLERRRSSGGPSKLREVVSLAHQ